MNIVLNILYVQIQTDHDATSFVLQTNRIDITYCMVFTD